MRAGGSVPGAEGNLQRTEVPEPLSTCGLQDRVQKKSLGLTPLVSHESFVEKDASSNNFFAVHLDFSRAAKSKTNEGYMNHIVS